MAKKILILLCAGIFIMSGCLNEEYSEDSAARQAMLSSQQAQLAWEAYIFGFPLVLTEVTKRSMTTISANTQNMPVNRIINYSSLPDAKTRHFIKPDRDIYYSFAWLDLSKEPVVLEIPENKQLYYNFALADAWTNILFNSSLTDEKKLKFIIAGPGWNGRRPENLTVFNSPTNTALWTLRIRFADRQNISPEIVKMQKEIKIIPLSQYGKVYAPPEIKAGEKISFNEPVEEVLEMKIDDYFNMLNELMIKNPPFAQDARIIDKMLDIGIAPGMRFETDMFSEEVLNEIVKIPENMRKFINASDMETGDNGWVRYESQDSYENNYYLRMRDVFESFDIKIDKNMTYGIIGKDAEKNILNGTGRYRISFEKGSLPAKKTFWSLSVYDKTGFYQSNALKRTGIGYRNTLKANPDGSIDIYIQPKTPGKDKESNWIPVNAGEFMLVFRSYSDEGRIVNLPVIKRIK